MTAPLLILHLSDLHFGPHSRFPAADLPRVARLHRQALDDARPALGAGGADKVDLVIVTGDIAEAARPHEYQDARAFFDALVAELELPRHRIVFVPGNHDVSWTETRKVCLDQDDERFDDAERDRRIQQVKLARFEQFVQAFHAGDAPPATHPLPSGGRVHSFPDLHVTVAALSSCERESHLAQGGYLGQAQAQAIMEHWRSPVLRSLLKIIAIHHNPVATVPENVRHSMQWLKSKKAALTDELLAHFVADTYGFEGRERLRAVAEDCQAQVVLHGHHHASGADPWVWKKKKGHTLVLSAGSWGLAQDALPEGQPAMAHFLRLDPASEEARSVLRLYERRARAEGQVEPGHFAIDAANPEGVRLHLCAPEGLSRAVAGADALQERREPLSGARQQTVIHVTQHIGTIEAGAKVVGVEIGKIEGPTT